MDMYKKRSYWNILLALLGLSILIITLLYSNYLAQKLKAREELSLQIYTEATQEILANDESSTDLNQDLGVISTIRDSNKLPVIIEDDKGELIGANFGDEYDEDIAYLQKRRQEFIDEGKKPLIGEGYASKVYYFNSDLVAYINYFPIIQLLLLSTFIMLGYFFLTASKRSEQNRVWAGMAKETAHQLGTPISAIIAWIEHLKLTDPSDEQLEIVEELRNDVKRLELVADRFSKIGSAPVLTPVNIYEELNECRIYMERRAPRKVTFQYPGADAGHLSVKINKHLFDWVIENLIRNSLDAMDGKGQLTANIYEDGSYVNIDMTDTGKGIPAGKQSTVFEPGFTTKKRGWGLGLSLAKRIIENYHRGKIFVKATKPGMGTTFTIRLPKAS